MMPLQKKKQLTKMADFHPRDFRICHTIVKKYNQQKLTEDSAHAYVPLRRKSVESKPPRQITFRYNSHTSRP